jgi:predicted PhzF superfamily epimerase YddE/YHI9
MAKVPFWHVDAFASRQFAGNPAAVLIFDTLPDAAELAAIAAENNLPATAFLAKDAGSEANYEIRWFSPKAEIGLCGHGTLAAGHVVLNESGAGGVTLKTRSAGIVEVRRRGAGYELCLPAIPTTQGERPEVLPLLGANPSEIWLSPDRYGIYLFEDERQIRALEPDFAGLAALGGDQFICTASGEKSDIVSRVFVPGGGPDEDSVTGSAHSALAPFWASRLGRDEFTAHQASQRGGDLTLRVERQAVGDRIWLGGECVIVAEGNFSLSG